MLQLLFSATEVATLVDKEHSTAAFSDDVIHMPLQCATQWDALSHAHYDGKLYNNRPVAEMLTSRGARELGVEGLARPGITSRGILVDIARLKDTEILPADYAITTDDLNEACASSGLTPRKGDILVVRTGHIRHFTVHRNRQAFNGPQSGLHYECARWVYEREIAAICADNVGVEILPSAPGAEMPAPLHMFCLRNMGMPLGEMFDLDELAEDCAQDNRYEFMLCASPLPITGAFGSPVNPIAIK